jgi:hypothetical protein
MRKSDYKINYQEKNVYRKLEVNLIDHFYLIKIMLGWSIGKVLKEQLLSLSIKIKQIKIIINHPIKLPKSQMIANIRSIYPPNK